MAPAEKWAVSKILVNSMSAVVLLNAAHILIELGSEITGAVTSVNARDVAFFQHCHVMA
jgi:hypothetical protein